MAQEQDTLNTEAPVLSVEDRLEKFLAAQDGEDQGEPTPPDAPQDDDSAPEEDTAESPEQEEEADEDAPPTSTRRLKIGEQEVEVTEEELEKGYLRQADYTRKTQDVAEKRKAVEAKEAALEAEREKYSVLLTKLEAQTRLEMGEEPDWDELAERDPAEFAIQYASWNRAQKRLETIEAEQQKLQRVAFERKQAELQERVQQENELLLGALPEWKNPEVRKKESEALREFGLKLGFDERALLSIVDHREILLLRNAMLYEQARSGNAKPVAGKPAQPQVAKPGSVPTKATIKGKQVAERRSALRKSGKPSDAEALLAALGIG